AGGSWVRRGDVDQLLFVEPDAVRDRLLGFQYSATYVFSATPADEAPIGTGCGTPTPWLAGEGLPLPISPAYRLDAHVAAGAPLLFAMDFTAASIALGGGRTQYLAAPVSVAIALADARGFAALPLPVPGNPALRGLAVYAQIAALQPAGPL